MISTLHGQLPLVIYPNPDLDVSAFGRVRICKVRGQALGHHLNFEISLNVDTGEVLLMEPGAFIGSFRIGDLIAAQVTQMICRAQAEQAEGGVDAQAH